MLKRKKIVEYFLQILAHAMFWVFVYFFFNYFLGYGSDNTEYVNKFSLFLMPITIVISYLFFFFLIPKYLLKKKHSLFILYSIYTVVISIFLIVISILYATLFLIHLKSENTSAITKTLPFIILGVYFVVLVVISIGLFIYNYKSIVKNEDLKNKILQTQLQLKEQELRLLKMQIHPHFLFNSLNTIYGYALKKEDQAPEMILKLSNLLDYILYQIEKPAVLLTNELNHIEDYIALEKIRFHDTLQVEFNQESISDTIMIAPMLLIPFVENSFKHGTIIDGVLSVVIDVSVKENKLIFSIQNSIQKDEDSPSGIGLENIKKRLEMLYQEKHELKIEQKENQFMVELIIDLK
tara:strand:- start:2520 stop:3572 length:1053 start_codon:yes stop_codon:yes gene_type:complete